MKDVVLVDYSYLYHKSWYVHSDLSYVTEDKVWRTGGIYGCIGTVKYLKNRYNCPIILATEPKRNFRFNMDEGYKKGRPKKDPEMYELWTETLSALSLIPGTFFITSEEEGEADDVINSFVKINSEKFDSFFIASTDNDYLQIVSGSNLKERVYYTPKSSREKVNILFKDYCYNKYEIDVDKILLFRAVFGDNSDNLPSVAPRIQKKFVREILQKENVVDVKSFLSEVWGFRGNNNADKIIHNQHALEKNYDIMRLRVLKLTKVKVEEKPLDFFIKSYGLKSLQEAVSGFYEFQ
jgi:5'-3' exonuclease